MAPAAQGQHQRRWYARLSRLEQVLLASSLRQPPMSPLLTAAVHIFPGGVPQHAAAFHQQGASAFSIIILCSAFYA